MSIGNLDLIGHCVWDIAHIVTGQPDVTTDLADFADDMVANILPDDIVSGDQANHLVYADKGT